MLKDKKQNVLKEEYTESLEQILLVKSIWMGFLMLDSFKV